MAHDDSRPQVPFIPTLTTPDDVSHFDPMFTMQERLSLSETENSEFGASLEERFRGFTFQGDHGAFLQDHGNFPWDFNGRFGSGESEQAPAREAQAGEQEEAAMRGDVERPG